MILTPLQKLPNNVGNLGKIIVATAFEWLTQSAKNRPIWSHWVRVIDIWSRSLKVKFEKYQNLFHWMHNIEVVEFSSTWLSYHTT